MSTFQPPESLEPQLAVELRGLLHTDEQLLAVGSNGSEPLLLTEYAPCNTRSRHAAWKG